MPTRWSRDVCAWVALILCLFALSSIAQLPATPQDHSSVARILNFEPGSATGLPEGWRGGPPGTVVTDSKVAHTGSRSARLTRSGESADTFSVLTQTLPIDFKGDQIQLGGYLRTEDVRGFAGLWLREDGLGKTLQFDNMQRQQVQGSVEWTQYSVTLPIARDADTLYFGVLLAGTGTAWADDLELLVNGAPIAAAPAAARKEATALDRDHAFDHGSGVVIQQLTPMQLANLAELARIWGFLKYHHSLIAAGGKHWDYELFRILPVVLAAKDRADAYASLLRWIDGLGPLKPCDPCAHLDRANLSIEPRLAWIADKNTLGKELSERLQAVYTDRPAAGQFYVTLQPGVGNPSFDHEPDYATIHLPDAGFQLLGLFRFWNIVQYWSPNREVAHEDWDAVLQEFIPRVAYASNPEAYQTAMMALVARMHDTHTNLWSSLALRPPVGACQLPVNLRFVDNKPVVAGSASSRIGLNSGLAAGDVIQELDGRPVAEWIKEWAPFYGTSNEAALERALNLSLTKGSCGPVRLSVLRAGKTVPLEAKREPIESLVNLRTTHDLPGPTFRLLSKDVAYLKLSSVKAADIRHDVELASGTKGLIVDIRNYPSEFVVFALGSLLVERPTLFARLTTADLANPGAFHWRATERLEPAQPHYAGKIVILVDETSISQAEYTAMALRAAPRTVIVGSTTAGADGNVSAIPLPGGLSTLISGIGVFDAERRPTQRVGIPQDVTVRPTIAGLQAGRDEVLETAIRQIVGDAAAAAQIERLSRQP